MVVDACSLEITVVYHSRGSKKPYYFALGSLAVSYMLSPFITSDSVLLDDPHSPPSRP